MYNRFDVGLHPSEPVGAIVGAVKDHVVSLQDHAQHLRNRMSQIKRALSDKKNKRGLGSSAAAAAAASAMLQKNPADNENGESTASATAVSFRNQPSIDCPPIDLAGISLEESSSSSREEGDWGPQKRPLTADDSKYGTESPSMSADEPKNKAGLIVCPLGGPLCDENAIGQGELQKTPI